MLGRLPTITQPERSIVIAAVSPTPPGQPARCCGMLANRLIVCVAGRQSTIVVPVPCRFDLSLKLSTSTSPAATLPAETGATTTE